MKNKLSKTWTIEYRKSVTEMWVENDFKSIFIANCDSTVPKDKRKINLEIAIKICDKLNEVNPYD
jgi:hypothetical protein